MLISYLKNLFKQLSKSKWIQIYFILVILQTLLSIPILVKTLINTEDIRKTLPTNQSTAYQDSIFGSYLILKEYKIIYENVLFIVYEIWRLWILTDGIVHLNSLTILASAWFSVFSCVFNVMLVVESRNWAISGFDSLKVENMRLQIALTVIFFLVSIPILIAAYKSTKVIGWQIYKKIGSSIHLKYLYHDVQRFALVLKVDIFFQVFLLIGTAIITQSPVFCILAIILSIMLVVGLLISRIAITRESHWMMIVFLTLQTLLLACNIYCFIGLFQYPSADIWYIGVIYVLASIISIIFTVYLAVQCQLNFGKGLKPFVKWYPFQSSNKDKMEKFNNESNLKNRRIDERLPIDDDDEEQDVGLLKQQEFYRSNDNIPRKSLERVDIIPYQLKADRYLGLHKLDSIEFLDISGIPVHRLEAQSVTRSSSSASRVTHESDMGITALKPPPAYSATMISLPKSDNW